MEVKYDDGVKLVYKFVNKVFPEVDRHLGRWNEHSGRLSNDVLRTQALESIALKRFHAQGGSIYALYPNADLQSATSFIVSLQTISDYLDNLCDRAGVCDEAAFRQLHLSMLDAVEPGSPLKDYYRFYPHKNDDGYLRSLVEECRLQIRKLPSYHVIAPYLKKYVKLYSELQTYKHLDKDFREERLLEWARENTKAYPDITCWEFSAATGSTLGIFVLFASASDARLTTSDVEKLDMAYFPWICGLHILLDYYIDSQEDLQEGDLNFTYYYSNLKSCEDRLTLFINKSFECCADLPYPSFHTTVIKGMLAMYLSDPKASWGLNNITSKNLLKRGHSGTLLYYNLCRLLRLASKI